MWNRGVMGLFTFLQELRESGRVRVPDPRVEDERDGTQAVDRWIVASDTRERLELAFRTPGLSFEVARWAALRLYVGCQLLAHRDAGRDQIQRAFEPPCPFPLEPRTVYSADLLFRYLPDLHRLARLAAPNDPLVGAIETFATRWPLSSVGIPGIPRDVAALRPVLASRALRQLYVDRILRRGDRDRLLDPGVERAVREALGSHAGRFPVLKLEEASP